MWEAACEEGVCVYLHNKFYYMYAYLLYTDTLQNKAMKHLSLSQKGTIWKCRSSCIASLWVPDCLSVCFAVSVCCLLLVH